MGNFQLTEDVKINPTKLNSYFSFMQGAKSENSKLFIPTTVGIATKQKWKRTVKLVDFILSSFLTI